jgi:uncharacterized membrane protein YkvI
MARASGTHKGQVCANPLRLVAFYVLYTILGGGQQLGQAVWQFRYVTDYNGWAAVRLRNRCFRTNVLIEVR